MGADGGAGVGRSGRTERGGHSHARLDERRLHLDRLRLQGARVSSLQCFLRVSCLVCDLKWAGFSDIVGA